MYDGTKFKEQKIKMKKKWKQHLLDVVIGVRRGVSKGVEDGRLLRHWTPHAVRVWLDLVPTSTSQVEKLHTESHFVVKNHSFMASVDSSINDR